MVQCYQMLIAGHDSHHLMWRFHPQPPIANHQYLPKKKKKSSILVYITEPTEYKAYSQVQMIARGIKKLNKKNTHTTIQLFHPRKIEELCQTSSFWIRLTGSGFFSWGYFLIKRDGVLFVNTLARRIRCTRELLQHHFSKNNRMWYTVHLLLFFFKSSVRQIISRRV